MCNDDKIAYAYCSLNFGYQKVSVFSKEAGCQLWFISGQSTFFEMFLSVCHQIKSRRDLEMQVIFAIKENFSPMQKSCYINAHSLRARWSPIFHAHFFFSISKEVTFLFGNNEPNPSGSFC